MKYFVIGGNTAVGHAVGLFLAEQGNSVLGYDEEQSALFPSVAGSLYETDRLREIISSEQFDAVVNCTAVINQFAEQDKAHAAFVNAYLPHFLESVTAHMDTIVVHRSTDCIFSGSRGGYTCGDMADGKSFYARTKAVGELVNDKDITIRTSLVGPETDPNGISLLNWFMRQRGEVKGFTQAIWTGLTTLEFAREIDCLVRAKAHGLLQCVPAVAISKYELLKLFDAQFPGERTVVPVENERVDKSLVQDVGGFPLRIPSYETMIREMAEWVEGHPVLYRHYYEEME